MPKILKPGHYPFSRDFYMNEHGELVPESAAFEEGPAPATRRKYSEAAIRALAAAKKRAAAGTSAPAEAPIPGPRLGRLDRAGIEQLRAATTAPAAQATAPSVTDPELKFFDDYISKLISYGYDPETAARLAEASWKHQETPPADRAGKTYTKEEMAANAPMWEIMLEHAAQARKLANKPYTPFAKSIEESIRHNPKLAEEMTRLAALQGARPDIYARHAPSIERKIGQDIAAEGRAHLPSEAKYNAKAREYMDSFHANITRALRDEAREEWEQDILPAIGAAYGSRGLHYSSARLKAQEKEKGRRQRALDREIGKLTHAARKDAHDVAHQLGEQGLRTFSEESRVKAADKEATSMLARSASDLATGQQSRQEIDRAAALQMGAQKQAEEQARVNEERRRFEEARDFAKHNLEFESGVIRGHRISPASFTPFVSTPPPPTAVNPYTAASGFIQTAAGLGNRRAGGSVRVKRNTGGAVRAPYAEGGSTPFVNYGDQQLPAFNTPEMAQIRELANEVRQSSNQGTGIDWLSAGLNTLANVRSTNPLGVLAQSVSHGRDVYEKTLESRNANKLRSAKLLDAINTSRLNQQKVLNEARENKEKLDEQARVHNAQIAASMAHADLFKAQTKKQELENKMYEPQSNEEQLDMPTKPLTPQREKNIIEADKAISGYKGILNAAKLAAETFKGLPTGTALGGIASFPSYGLGQYAAGALSGKDSEQWADAEAASNNLISQLSGFEKNVGRSIPHLNLVKASKAGITQTPQMNVELLTNIMEKSIKDAETEIKRKKISGAPLKEIIQDQEELNQYKEYLEQYKSLSEKEKKTSTEDESKAAKIAQLERLIAEKKAKLAG